VIVGKAMPSQSTLRAAVGASLGQLALTAGGNAAWYPYDASNWASDVGSSSNYICKDGSEQSPIDFPTCNLDFVRSEPELTWETKAGQLLNNGHTVQITATGNEGEMKYSIAGITKKYKLLQCHVHYGSEHFIGGNQEVFETHCVHQMVSNDESVRYGVFGVFFEVGGQSSFLQQFIDAGLPAKPSGRRLQASEGVSFNVHGDPLNNATKRRLAAASDPVDMSSVNFLLLKSDLLAANNEAMQHYWNYDGSFTTPPCTEAVDFYIYQTRATMSSAQLTDFRDAIDWGDHLSGGGNFRPPQPLKNRNIYGCGSEPPALVDGAWYPYKAENWATRVGGSSHAVCDGGSQQSPIDFETCLEARQQNPLSITWTSQAATMSNNGHTVVINVADSAASGEMSGHGKDYRLLQCHFHWGSEHTVGGMQYPFEVHCVHQQASTVGTEAPHYGVFGQFYEVGDTANPFLATIDTQLPSAGRRLAETSEIEMLTPKVDLMGRPMDRRLAGGSSNDVSLAAVNFKDLYGENALTHFWNYGGSFTTPPCTEAVDFFIMMHPAQMSAAQLTAFKVAIGWTNAGGNFRPPQPLGSRVVAGCARVASVNHMLDDHATVLTSSIKDAIEDTVGAQMTAALDEHQGNHSAMLTALVVLSAFMVVVSFAMLGMMFKIMKMPMPAQTKIPASEIGAGERQTV